MNQVRGSWFIVTCNSRDQCSQPEWATDWWLTAMLPVILFLLCLPFNMSSNSRTSRDNWFFRRRMRLTFRTAYKHLHWAQTKNLIIAQILVSNKSWSYPHKSGAQKIPSISQSQVVCNIHSDSLYYIPFPSFPPSCSPCSPSLPSTWYINSTVTQCLPLQKA